MRRFLVLLILFTSIFFKSAYCEVFLFNDVDIANVDLSQKSKQIIEKSVLPYTDSYKIVKYDLSASVKKDLEIKFYKDFPILLTKDLEEIKSNRIKVRYKIEKDGFLLLSIMNDDIDGTLFSEKAQYAIKSLGNGYQVIYEVLQEKYSRKCGTEDIINPNNIEHSIKTSFEKVGNPIECNLRIIVLYTPTARDAVSNIRNISELAVDVTNQTFINSNINHEFELAYCALTSYTESGNITTDRDRFFGQNDGFMDEVHDLRNMYAADCCVLMTDGASTTTAGIAKAIFADKEHMFCVSEVSFSVDNLTFPHEIGHLLGARHDTDPNTTPFTDGHGFKDATNNFRTVMAVFSSTIHRVAHWSNPSVNYNGHPTGIAGTSNNAGVLNSTIIDARTFRQPVTTVILSNDVVTNLDARDLVSANNITTNGVVTISNNSNATYRAATSITLKPGFTASSGSDFVASIETVDVCPGDPNAGGTENGGQTFDKKNSIITEKSVFEISCYPNPISTPYHLKLEVLNSNFSFQIFDAIGNQIDVPFKRIENVGFDIDMSNIMTGFYFIKAINEDNSEQIFKVIKK